MSTARCIPCRTHAHKLNYLPANYLCLASIPHTRSFRAPPCCQAPRSALPIAAALRAAADHLDLPRPHVPVVTPVSGSLRSVVAHAGLLVAVPVVALPFVLAAALWPQLPLVAARAQNLGHLAAETADIWLSSRPLFPFGAFAVPRTCLEFCARARFPVCRSRPGTPVAPGCCLLLLVLRLKLQLPDSLSLLPVTSGGSELLPPHPPNAYPARLLCGCVPASPRASFPSCRRPCRRCCCP
jgi:hypothetical protein